MKSTPRATIEPELLKYFFPFSPSGPAQLFPSVQLAAGQKKSLRELVGKEVTVHHIYSTTYHYGREEETYSNPYGCYKSGIRGTLKALLGFGPDVLSHVVLGPSSFSGARRRNLRRYVIPLEHQKREGNITETSLVRELESKQASFSFLIRRLYWRTRNIATLLDIPPAHRKPFFHALQHSYGTCTEDYREGEDLTRQARLAAKQARSADSVSATGSAPKSGICPYRFGSGDVAGILQRYLYRLDSGYNGKKGKG